MVLKYKHNQYRKSVQIINYKTIFDSVFKLKESGLEISDIYLTKGNAHRFHQTDISNKGKPLIFSSNSKFVNFLYVYNNQIVDSQKYSDLISAHIPSSCFVDVYLDSRNKSISEDKIYFEVLFKEKNIQTCISIGENNTKIKEYQHKKNKLINEKMKQNEKPNPIEYYRIAQLKAEEERKNIYMAIASLNSKRSNKSMHPQTIYNDRIVAHDYDYLLLNN